MNDWVVVVQLMVFIFRNDVDIIFVYLPGSRRSHTFWRGAGTSIIPHTFRNFHSYLSQNRKSFFFAYSKCRLESRLRLHRVRLCAAGVRTACRGVVSQFEVGTTIYGVFQIWKIRVWNRSMWSNSIKYEQFNRSCVQAVALR